MSCLSLSLSLCQFCSSFANVERNVNNEIINSLIKNEKSVGRGRIKNLCIYLLILNRVKVGIHMKRDIYKLHVI